MGKPIAIIVIFIVTILFIVTFINIANQSKKYEINLPDVEAIKSIVISKSAGTKEEVKKEITEGEDLQKIWKTLKGANRKTEEESIQDTPVNARDIIRVDINHTEGGTSTVYVYRRMPNFYMEQPYNGIYKISIDDYYVMADYLK